jgi:hypothetical protein
LLVFAKTELRVTCVERWRSGRSAQEGKGVVKV